MSRTIERMQREMAQVAEYEADDRAGADKTIRRVLGAAKNAKSLADLSVATATLATQDMVGGALRVLAGDGSGWKQLGLGLSWQVVEQRTLRRLYDENPRPRKQAYSNPNDLAISLLHALSCEHAETGWLREQARASFSGGAFDEVGAFPLAAYALTLAEGRTEYAGDDDSVYARVIAAWNDEQSLHNAVVAMLDYHMVRTEDVHDSENLMEFVFYPYPLFPVEYLALERVRERAGLPTPRPKHALLSTPLGELPPIADGASSPLLDSVRAFLA
jgi:hypothetical protein